MKLAVYPLALLFVGGLVFGAALLTAGEASAQQEAITGIVSGEAIQKVGFRAMIQKQAIMYDLAGYCSQCSRRNGEHHLAGRQGPDR